MLLFAKVRAGIALVLFAEQCARRNGSRNKGGDQEIAEDRFHR